MKALVTYDSSNGSADKIAEAICLGMKQMGFADAVCKPAGNVTAADLQGAEVWVLGSPNGFLAGRKVSKVIKNATGGNAVKAVAFETRQSRAAAGSVEKIAAALSAKGVTVVDRTYFSLGSNGLLDGEEDLAVAYGRNLANLVV